MTYPALVAALRAVIDHAPGRVLRLKVTPEQARILRYDEIYRPTFRGIPLVVKRG